MRLRPYRPGDAPRLAKIFQESIREIGARDYSAAQVEAWAGPRLRAERLHDKYSDGRATFIAVDEADRAIAFSDVEADGHVDMLYCDPAHARRGFASALLAAVEASAREANITTLYAEASETARPVFEKAGYTAVSRRDFEVEGVAMHNWKMEKQL